MQAAAGVIVIRSSCLDKNDQGLFWILDSYLLDSNCSIIYYYSCTHMCIRVAAEVQVVIKGLDEIESTMHLSSHRLP